MTQAADLSTQTPSEALTSGTDAVSEAQKAMDTEGPKPAPQPEPAPKYITEAEHSRVVSDLAGQVRGLQGVVDRTEKTVRDMTDGARQQQIDTLISRLPEDQQELERYRQKQIDGLIANQQSVLAAPAPQVGLDQDGAMMVQEYGISPTDSRLDAAGYQRGGAAGVKALMDSIYAIQNQGQRVVPDNSAPQPTIQPPSPNAAPAASGTGLDSGDAVRSALIERRITPAQYVENMQRLGEQV